jgi:tetratricopeptide (TPR) repeat protein
MERETDKIFQKTILVFLFLALASFLNAQSLKSLLKQGQEAMQDQNYFSAAQIYNRIILIDSSNLDFQYNYAEASRLNYDLDIALHWYEKVFKKDNAKTFPETTFWIGQLLKSKGKYKEAKKMFSKFYQKNKSSKISQRKALAEKARLETEACDLALILMKNPVSASVEHLDTNINSKVSEYAPFETDTSLIFSSLRKNKDKDKSRDSYYNKLYSAQKSETGFLTSTLLDSTINQQGLHTANTCFNSNYTKFYSTRCGAKNASTFNCEIWVSEKQNGKWQEFKKLPETINVPTFSTTQPNMMRRSILERQLIPEKMKSLLFLSQKSKLYILVQPGIKVWVALIFLNRSGKRISLMKWKMWVIRLIVP